MVDISYHQTGSLIDMADPERARRTVRDMAEVGGDWLYERTVANTPVSYHGLALQFGGFKPAREPGTLKRSWKRLPAEPSLDRIGGGWMVAVETDDPIAQFVEWDTAPHEIRPKLPGGLLVFRTWPTGELVRTKLVHHPGTQGQHMSAFAVHAAELSFDEIVHRPLMDWARLTEQAGAH